MLAAGFSDPVRESQAVFRAVMTALARPAAARPLATSLQPPAPLTPELAAVALALADHETPLWLDAPLAASAAAAEFLRFHTGASIVTDRAAAAFALIADPLDMPPFADFALGSDEYPDRSATLLVAVTSLDARPAMSFAGPGIEDRAAFSPAPMPADFGERLAVNRALFPRGVDLIFVAPGGVAALPRSVRIV